MPLSPRCDTCSRSDEKSRWYCVPSTSYLPLKDEIINDVIGGGSSFLCGDGGCDNGHSGPPCSIIISSSSRHREQWQNRRHHTATVSAAVIQFLVHQSVDARPPREHPSSVVPIFPCIEAPIVHVYGRHKRQAPRVPSGWALLVLSAASPGLQYELRVQEELSPSPSHPIIFCQDSKASVLNERTDGSETPKVETAMMLGAGRKLERHRPKIGDDEESEGIHALIVLDGVIPLYRWPLPSDGDDASTFMDVTKPASMGPPCSSCTG